MNNIDTVNLSKSVLNHLSQMGYEFQNRHSSGQLIFPMKTQGNGTKFKDRISEQELRLLFIEEFKKNYENLFYSIETPTTFKHFFGKLYEDIRSDGFGQSASIDMCIFKRNPEQYSRILNIEFKSKNPPLKDIAKDILKLVSEQCDGAFIHLLHNSDSGTFRNARNTGVFDKYYKSFFNFQANWNNEKSIQLIIISLKQKVIIHRKIKKQDLENLSNIFYLENPCGNIDNINSNGWVNERL